MFRWRDDALNRPSSPDACAEGSWFDAKKARPLGEMMRHAIDREANIRSSVRLLRRLWKPYAVASFVSLIVVHALNSVSQSWTWTHIAKEGRERITPFLTDRYASASVVLVGRDSVVFATLDNALPNDVFWRARQAMRSVGAAFYNLSFQAPARFTVASSEIQKSRRDDLTAGTSTTYASAFASFLRFFDHSQATILDAWNNWQASHGRLVYTA